MIGKRGQFYLIAAIIIVLVLYSLSTRVNTLQEQPRFTDFNKIAENYADEAAKVVNYGIYNNIANINDELIAPFTQNYLDYARTKDNNIGIVYVYADKDKTVIENHNKEGVVHYDSITGSSGTLFSSEDEAINHLGLNIGGEEFVHDIPVKIGLFSPSYYSSTLPNEKLKIDIAGIPYSIDTTGGDSFDVVINTVNEQTPGTVNSKTCSYSSTGGWVCP